MIGPAARRYLGVPACLLLAVASARAEGPYRMQGAVTDAGTQEPIAEAEVQVLIQSELDPARRVLRAKTDKQGQYSLELPAGHAWAWMVTPPAGYCAPEVASTGMFATTAEEPVFRKNYELQKGLPLDIVARLPEGVAPPLPIAAALSQQREGKYVHGYCQLNEQGQGVVTLPELEGKFSIHCGDESRTLHGPQEATVEFASGFDPQHVQPEIQRDENGTVTVRDAANRAARLIGCEARVQDKRLALVLQLTSTISADDVSQVEGQVTDADGRGIADATVEVALHSGQSSAMSGIKTRSNKHGRFSLNVPQVSTAEQISLAVTRAGYASLDTEPLKLPKPAERLIDAGMITLPAASSIRIRAVDADGKPLHGAVVEPLSGYAARTRIARTGRDGECRITDLASGIMPISAQFGTLTAHLKIPLDEGENELVVLKLLPPPPAAPAEEPQPERSPLAVGAAAPEWTITAWTDGKQRKLADYRGKVVVLDFWGTWCDPCIKAIPLMKSLHERYQGRDVAFLGIHTAGTELSLVKRLLKQEEWDITVGLDEGESVASGSTTRSYAIGGFPSVLVVDPEGKIAFNTDVPAEARAEQMRQIAELAKANGIPWPLDQDAPEQETLATILRLHELLLSQAIDRALRAPSK
jgi:thiol-disulfide isomerase/thioredoxin